MSSPRHRLASRGFTLIELIITIALVAVILGIGVPSLTSMLRDNAIVAITNELVADLQFARSEAIKRNQPVAICRANAALDGCVADASWENGWIVFPESAGAANGTLDAGETVIRTHNGVTAGDATIRVPGNATNLAGVVIFQSDGVPMNAVGQSLRPVVVEVGVDGQLGPVGKPGIEQQVDNPERDGRGQDQPC